MNWEPAMDATPSKDRPEPFVRVRDVEHRYDSGVASLAGISTDIGRSEFVAIVGPSGCGKSTLLSLIAGLRFPTEGSIAIDGDVVTGPHRRMGMMFQNDLLFDWMRVRENVMLQSLMRQDIRRDFARKQADDLLDQVDLSAFANRWPWELSGGMRQRVALCRTLLMQPDIILLDEPFGALDALTRMRMNLLLLQLWEDQKSCVLLITHDVAEAVLLADRVIVMTGRPGVVKREVVIDLPRPRSQETLGTARFAALEAQLLADLLAEE
jgi:NitT/TauT family transport system ATP-binding protein